MAGLIVQLFYASAILVAAIATVVAVASLHHPHLSHPTLRAFAIVAGLCALAFAAGFFGHDPAGNVFGVAAWILFFGIVFAGTVSIARLTPGGWGPIFAGLLLASTFFSGFAGDYAAHAAGWHGESLDGYSGDMAPAAHIFFPILFSPAVFLVGVIAGIIVRTVPVRRPAPSA